MECPTSAFTILGTRFVASYFALAHGMLLAATVIARLDAKEYEDHPDLWPAGPV